MSGINNFEKTIIVFARQLSAVLIRALNQIAMPKLSSVHRNVVITNRKQQRLGLDIFEAEQSDHVPVIMMIHGGGFVGGDKLQIERSCRVFAQAGFLVFNVNYRLAPEHPYPEAVEDCEDLLAWVRENAGKYGGDVERICVGGGSAGAYLASCLAIKSQEENSQHIDAVLLLNGCFDVDMTYHSDFPQARVLLRCFLQKALDDGETPYQASTLNFVNERFPNTFIGVGTQDSLLNQSQALRDRLLACNVKHAYHEYLGSHHGWFSWFWTKNAKRAHKDMLVWLKSAF